MLTNIFICACLSLSRQQRNGYSFAPFQLFFPAADTEEILERQVLWKTPIKIIESWIWTFL